MSNQNPKGDAILRLPHVKERTGLSRSSIYAGMKSSTFPTPISLTDDGRAVGWLASEIEAWIQSRKATRQEVAA